MSEPGRTCLRPPPAQAGLPDPATMKRSHSILVVDDEKTIADGLRLTLESEGYGVRTAGGVREALGTLAQSDPHAAIVDLMLPDGDGLQPTRQLKRRDPATRGTLIPAHRPARQ